MGSEQVLVAEAFYWIAQFIFNRPYTLGGSAAFTTNKRLSGIGISTVLHQRADSSFTSGRICAALAPHTSKLAAPAEWICICNWTKGRFLY